MKTIKLLEKWLAISGNSEALLAHKLGYKTTTTISVWRRRGRIPRIAERHVLEIIASKEKK